MGRMKEVFMAEQDRVALNGGPLDAQDYSYKLYVAEQALEEIARLGGHPAVIASATLAKINAPTGDFP